MNPGDTREKVLLLPVSAGTGRHAAPANAADSPRRTLSLDGIWQIAEGGMDQAPSLFERTVPVPGLVDMAKPALGEGRLVRS